MAITVEGKKYQVTEDLGWQFGLRAKAVKYPDSPTGERVAIKSGSIWVWHRPQVILTHDGGYRGQSA